MNEWMNSNHASNGLFDLKYERWLKPILAAGKITKNACYKNNIKHREVVTHFTADR